MTDVLGKLIRGVHVAVIVEQLEDIHSHVIHHPGVFCSHHQVSNDARVICHLSCESLTNLVKLLNLQLETVCLYQVQELKYGSDDVKHNPSWQSQIEIEYYSITYFERITEFDLLSFR